MKDLLSARLKNLINKDARLNIEYEVKNTVINRRKIGCTGFITNKDNGTIVYVSTENPNICNLGYMYRFADSSADFKGRINHFCKDEETYAKEIINALRTDPDKIRDPKH